MQDVSIVSCQSYESAAVEEALNQAISGVGGLDWVSSGMKIAIKANLVSMMKPEAAATTHPALLCALVKMLVARGADVVVGDSPGGTYSTGYVNLVYKATGMHAVEECGGHLNQDFSETEIRFTQGNVLRDFHATSYLEKADAIIDFCKLKTHGMMGMSAAVKNLFGVIPGTMKPEYHFRFPTHEQFAKMLVDINAYYAEKIKLVICDAVVGMEGNGPTMGTPRKIGAVLASKQTHALDLVCAEIIGLSPADVPTLQVALEEGLIPATSADLKLSGDLSEFKITDYQNIHVRRSLLFEGKGKFAAVFVRSALKSKPMPDRKLCVGCKKCEQICPAKAISMKNGIPSIDRNACITCFCCQEFCPKGAMKVHRPWIAKLLNKI